MSAQGEFERAHDELAQALQYFHDHSLYYYEAQACIAIAMCELKLNKEPKMLEHLRRAVDLAARYDYEYWLKRESSNNPELFATEEAQELLPLDLREQLARAQKPDLKPAAVPGAEIALTSKTGYRSDYQHVGAGADSARSNTSAGSRRLDHATRSRHLVFHHVAPPPSGIKRHNHRYVLGRNRSRGCGEKLSSHCFAHTQSSQQ